MAIPPVLYPHDHEGPRGVGECPQPVFAPPTPLITTPDTISWQQGENGGVFSCWMKQFFSWIRDFFYSLFVSMFQRSPAPHLPIQNYAARDAAMVKPSAVAVRDENDAVVVKPSAVAVREENDAVVVKLSAVAVRDENRVARPAVQLQTSFEETKGFQGDTTPYHQLRDILDKLLRASGEVQEGQEEGQERQKKRLEVIEKAVLNFTPDLKKHLAAELKVDETKLENALLGDRSDAVIKQTLNSLFQFKLTRMKERIPLLAPLRAILASPRHPLDSSAIVSSVLADYLKNLSKPDRAGQVGLTCLWNLWRASQGNTYSEWRDSLLEPRQNQNQPQQLRKRDAQESAMNEKAWERLLKGICERNDLDLIFERVDLYDFGGTILYLENLSKQLHDGSLKEEDLKNAIKKFVLYSCIGMDLYDEMDLSRRKRTSQVLRSTNEVDKRVSAFFLQKRDAKERLKEIIDALVTRNMPLYALRESALPYFVPSMRPEKR